MTISIRALTAAACALLFIPLAAARVNAQAATLTPEQQALHDIYKQLIETNTEDSAGVGSVTKASEQIAARFRAAGFPDSDIHLVGPTPDKHAIIVRYHGTGARKPLLLLAHLDVVEAQARATGRWIRSRSSRRTVSSTARGTERRQGDGVAVHRQHDLR